MNEVELQIIRDRIALLAMGHSSNNLWAERYQADASALLFEVARLRKESERLRAELAEAEDNLNEITVHATG
jgi:hypothetical protein